MPHGYVILLPTMSDQESHVPEKSTIINESHDDELFKSIMMQNLTVSDDFMNKLQESVSLHGSISELSHSVNDSQKGCDFDEVYEKKEIIGEGGFSIVYRCVHKERIHSYAVKEILDENCDVNGSNVANEISSLKKLRDGPYIVRLLDVYTAFDQSHLVMEFMQGGDLLAKLCEKECFPELEARSITKRLIEAIRFCHKKHIVHRDIKLENVLLSDRSDDTKIKLADFGCSCGFIPETKCLRTLCGSTQYAAPELYSHENYDEKCDLWSAGVVIFAILGGYAPFEAATHDLPKIVCEGHFNFPRKYWNDISDIPKSLIKSLLVVNPEDRATIEDVLDSEWLRRRDKESVMKLNLDGSCSNVFDAWVKLQNESKHPEIIHRTSTNSVCKPFCIDELEV